MSALTLTVRAGLTGDIDVAALLPERLAGLDPQAVARLEVKADGRPMGAGEIFHVEGGDSETLVFEPGGARLHGVGAGMGGGRITVAGDAGDYAARDLRGGTLRVQGCVGHHAGTRMRGGLLEVDGDAGDFLGGALPGERHGLRGGTLVVHGSAGDRVGDRMRRGLVVVEGNAGDWCGARMLAGTVIVLGRVGDGVGFGMRRGTLLLKAEPAALAALFNDCGEHDLLFLTLLRRHLETLPSRFGALAPSHRPVRRYVGDQSVEGQGEVLVWCDGPPA